MIETEVDRRHSCRIHPISDDQLSVDASHDPDLSYMFDVEDSISVPSFQDDEKRETSPLHRSAEDHRIPLRIEHTNRVPDSSHDNDTLNTYMYGTKWSNNSFGRPDCEITSVQTAPEQKLAKPRNAKSRNTEINKLKTGGGRNDTSNDMSMRRKSAGCISVSGAMMQEGRFKLSKGELVAETESQRRRGRGSLSSVVSEVTIDFDDDLSVQSALTFQTCKSSNHESTVPTTQWARARKGRWWRYLAPERESTTNQRPRNSGSINAYVGRFKMRNGKFIPINDSSASKSCSLDAMAEAVRRAAAKTQRNVVN